MREADPARDHMKSTNYETLSNAVSLKVDFSKQPRPSGPRAPDTASKTRPPTVRNVEIVLRRTVSMFGEKSAVFEVKRGDAATNSWLTYSTRIPVKQGEPIRATRKSPSGEEVFDTGLVLVSIGEATRTVHQTKREFVIEDGRPVQKEVVREVHRRVQVAIVKDMQSGDRVELVQGEASRRK